MSDYKPPDPLPPPLPIFNGVNWKISEDMIIGTGGGGMGVQGAQGLQGNQGFQGNVGTAGTAGTAGAQGFQGWQGIAGPSPTVFGVAQGSPTTTFDIDANGPLQKLDLVGTTDFAVTVSTNRAFVLMVEQGIGGSHTANFFSTINWAGGSPPVLTTTGGKTDTFGFIRTSPGIYLGYIIGLNA